MHNKLQTKANCDMGPNISKHLYLHEFVLCCALCDSEYLNITILNTDKTESIHKKAGTATGVLKLVHLVVLIHSVPPFKWLFVDGFRCTKKPYVAF